MVRIWNTPIYELKRQRFLGLHNECGVAYNALMRRLCWLKYPNFFKYLQETIGFKITYINHPQVKRFIGHEGQLVDLHDNIIVEDFKRRGYKHNSSLIKGNCLSIPKEKFNYSMEEYIKDHEELMKRQNL